MLVAGADGCKKGWLVVVAGGSSLLRLRGDPFVASTFEELLAATRRCAKVGVDIPIGLCEDEYWRAADGAARDCLGARRNAVFAARVSAVLVATSHKDACERSQRATGKRISIQLYNILEKIVRANASMTPELQRRIVEVHPEVSFWALNDCRPMTHSKKKPRGVEERLDLLRDVFEDDLASVSVPSGAARDDLYDACAAAWTARRYAAGQHGTLPEHPPRDARGLRMEIVY